MTATRPGVGLPRLLAGCFAIYAVDIKPGTFYKNKSFSTASAPAIAFAGTFAQYRLFQLF
jgi:hypothetical protein